MPRLQFRNFSDLGFIQSVDKPRFLGPLLADHKDYFTRQGLNVVRLTNDDGCDRKLLAAFTQADEDMPPALLETLYELDDLSDESGHDRILEEADRMGIKLNGVYEDLNPGEFAIAVFRDHAHLVHFCHQKTIYRKIKNYQEYQSKDGKALSLKKAKAHRVDLENALAPEFEARKRSRACEIHVYEEKGEIRFQITHGRPYKTDGTIDKQLNRSRVAYRPQKHDSVIFDNQMRVLKINAQTAPEKELYRRTFGKVLFGDVEYFPEGDIYTLEPLRNGKAAIKLVPGVESVRLSEVRILIDDDQRFTQTSRGYNLFEAIAKHGKPNLQEGRIVRAAFLIKYSNGGRPRKLELRPPNIAILDRDRDGAVAEAFMAANDLLKVDLDE
ncbi:MAG: hypothetical protein CSB49_04050 [Proteobacteria bacterium]|nr:MAG: hypothetical protein CSB49_04050 [Pseudomonadota bacterium]